MLGGCAPFGVKLLPDPHFIRSHYVPLLHPGQQVFRGVEDPQWFRTRVTARVLGAEAFVCLLEKRR